MLFTFTFNVLIIKQQYGGKLIWPIPRYQIPKAWVKELVQLFHNEDGRRNIKAYVDVIVTSTRILQRSSGMQVQNWM